MTGPFHLGTDLNAKKGKYMLVAPFTWLGPGQLPDDFQEEDPHDVPADAPEIDDPEAEEVEIEDADDVWGERQAEHEQRAMVIRGKVALNHLSYGGALHGEVEDVSLDDVKKEEEKEEEVLKTRKVIGEEMKFAIEDDPIGSYLTVDAIAALKETTVNTIPEEALQTKIVAQHEVRRNLQEWIELIKAELKALFETKKALLAIDLLVRSLGEVSQETDGNVLGNDEKKGEKESNGVLSKAEKAKKALKAISLVAQMAIAKGQNDGQIQLWQPSFHCKLSVIHPLYLPGLPFIRTSAESRWLSQERMWFRDRAFFSIQYHLKIDTEKT
ncbi:unnamed protein product [Cladocopium goreaui]|uniref:Uncharacterized protein n=1 Tax=Cladocopium goreaui TaxID=2562237 RepID=A0A9P1FL04_9DINO|nr:unnamed protein product [Cladocopium goreaui]